MTEASAIVSFISVLRDAGVLGLLTLVIIWGQRRTYRWDGEVKDIIAQYEIRLQEMRDAREEIRKERDWYRDMAERQGNVIGGAVDVAGRVVVDRIQR